MAKEKPLAEFKGTNGKIYLYPNRVSVKKNAISGSSLMSFGNQKEIYLQQIVGVEIKKPGIQTGFISIRTSEDVKASKKMHEENTVSIGPLGMSAAKKFKEAVDKAVSASYQGSAPQQTDDTADQIQKYKQLLDSGAITEDEYNAKKQQLLGI